MPTRNHARRPIGWNALLRKGHAHTRARSSERRAHKASLDDEIDAYLFELGEAESDEAEGDFEDDAARHGRRPPPLVFALQIPQEHNRDLCCP